MPNFEFLAFIVPEIRGGPIIPKLGHVIPSDLIFLFFLLVPLEVHLHAKFRDSSFYRSRDRKAVSYTHLTLPTIYSV